MDYSNYPKDRATAKATGAKYYYTGQPCVRGHVALRKTKGSCVDCMKEDWAIDNKKRSEKPKSEASRAAGKRYYEKNKEAVKARANARPKDEVGQYKRKYKEANPELYKALVSVRKRRHRSATPKWITPEQKLAIRQLYLQAMQLTKMTGERYVVDHIVPLISDEVCGLHVPWNLRVITQEENLKKSNKLLDNPLPT
jgi:5-methylcytosine-specific restriction endonuclease McrA